MVKTNRFRKRSYIGISNSFHDGSIAIINSKGEIVFAEATERYLQNKRAVYNIPDQFIRIDEIISQYCNNDSDLVVANTWSEDAHTNLANDVDLAIFESFVKKAPLGSIPKLLLDRYAFLKLFASFASFFIPLSTTNLEYGISQREKKKKNDIIVTKKKYDHHLTHAATACFTSPFASGVCAIIDGHGEKRSHSCYVYENNKIDIIKIKKRANLTSLGFFYMTICRLCGFGLFKGEEWKVMGLAAYGKFNKNIYGLIKPLIGVDGLNIVQCGFPEMFQIFKNLDSYRRDMDESPLTVADLAHTAQVLYSETLYKFLNNLYEVTDSENIILGGGCLLNSSANGQILQKTKFKKSYIFSAPGDDGCSIGAALLAYYEDHPGEIRKKVFQSPYLGSEISEKSIRNLKNFGKTGHLEAFAEKVHIEAAQLLAEGKIIGWVQGKAEFGPRALGNRSILADPRSSDAKDRINSRIKFREGFRPFAPSILHEHGDEYFENYQESPYMERTLCFKKKMIEKVPGVVHEDHTGRLQTVKKEWNEKFYQLIKEFFKLTGVPIVLNTSFNIMGKPIIHSLEDAIAVFYTTDLDALVVENLIIKRK